ncbi:MAG: thioesterase family protein, partial [Caulobacteraceae bacterium]
MSENQGAVEVWRGGVQTWECDAMGHMNIRFYVSRAMEGLAGLAAALGLSDAFTARAASTLLVREHHIRFLREARADAPLYMEAGVVEMGETDALLLQVLRHSVSREPAATLLTRVAHASPGAGQVFAWPKRVRAAAEKLRVDIPDFAAPRGIDGGPVSSVASRERAEALGLPCGARGAVMPSECDVFGRMRPEMAMGRMSDGMSFLLQTLNDTVAKAAP